MFMFRRLNICKMSSIVKLTSRLSVIVIKNSRILFWRGEINKLIFKFIWKFKVPRMTMTLTNKNFNRLTP